MCEKTNCNHIYTKRRNMLKETSVLFGAQGQLNPYFLGVINMHFFKDSSGETNQERHFQQANILQMVLSKNLLLKKFIQEDPLRLLNHQPLRIYLCTFLLNSILNNPSNSNLNIDDLKHQLRIIRTSLSYQGTDKIVNINILLNQDSLSI